MTFPLRKYIVLSSAMTMALLWLFSVISTRNLNEMRTSDKFVLAPDHSILKTAAGGGKAGICMDRRLQKELVEQGILSVEDLPKTMPEDEILNEIKKCQQELATVNEYNLEELNKLRTIVAKDLRRQEVKEALDKVDSQVLEMYNTVLVSKQNQVATEEEDLEKNGLITPLTKDIEPQADIILKQQAVLHREITELTDFPQTT